MAEIESGKFACDNCGKQYKWKPELAGKKAKCKCGAALNVPATMPEAMAPEPEPDLYDLAPVAEAPKPKPPPSLTSHSAGASSSPASVPKAAPIKPSPTKVAAKTQTGSVSGVMALSPMAMAGGGAAVASSPVAQPAAAPVLPYLGQAKPAISAKEELENTVGGSLMRELYMPAALVLLGIALQIWLSMEDSGGRLTVVRALPAIAVRLFVNLALCFTGMFIVARLFEISFGAPGPAVLKAAACCLLPPALGDVIGGMVGGSNGFVSISIGSLLFFPLTWVMLWWLFSLDFGEALWLETVIWLVNQWVIMFILGLILSGSNIGGMGGGGGAASQSEDQRAAQLLNQAEEGKAWIAKSENRLIGAMPHPRGVQVVDDLYALGAIDVSVLADGPVAEQIIVTLPKKRDARAKLFAWQATYAKLIGDDPDVDDGQKYMRLHFPGEFYGEGLAK